MSSDWSETVGIRLATLDLVRACEQTALVTSLCQGRGVLVRSKEEESTDEPANTHGRDDHVTISEDLVRRLARWSMLGYLVRTECQGRVVQFAAKEGLRAGKEAREWLPRAQLIGRPYLSDNLELAEIHNQPPWQLDFVVAPIDGVRDFVEGYHDGSVTFLVGGKKDSFVPQFKPAGDPHGSNYYFVTMVPRHNKSLSLTINMGLLKKGFDQKVDNLSLLRKLLKIHTVSSDSDALPGHLGRRPPIIGTMSPPPNSSDRHYTKSLRYHFGRSVRTHSFSGSPVAAAIAVMATPGIGPGIDGFVGVVNRAQATAIAVAAKSSGAVLPAMPLKATPKEREAKNLEFFFLPNSTTFDEKEFVKEDHAFLIVTGITECFALQGVRYDLCNQVTTHTLLIRDSTLTTRSILTSHDLTKKNIHLLMKTKHRISDADIDEKTFFETCHLVQSMTKNDASHDSPKIVDA